MKHEGNEIRDALEVARFLAEDLLVAVLSLASYLANPSRTRRLQGRLKCGTLLLVKR